MSLPHSSQKKGMSGIEFSNYMHSPVHRAVISRDYGALKRIIAALPRLSDPSEIRSEAQSMAEEEKADAISSVIDRRDVPNRETPLHLAVRLSDAISAEILVAAGADHSLQNEQGWSAVQEAICLRQEHIAKLIVRCYQPSAWAKWCRRLPRLVSTMERMRDFYMEITFHFESSMIPFVSRIAPSDTYKIWKQGANLRADMTLAGFDGFRIQRADQSVLFFGSGSEDGKLPTGSLLMVSHKEKEVLNALDGARIPVSEEDIEKEVASMLKTNMFRPGIDVTQSVLLPQLTWRKQEKTESVGSWKAKVYDMHHVVVSMKSRPVPGAMTDGEFFSSCNGNENVDVEYEGILTEEERKQLQDALKQRSSDVVECDLGIGTVGKHAGGEFEDAQSLCNGGSKQEKKGWLSNWGRKSYRSKQDPQMKMMPPRSSLCVDSKVGNLLGDSPIRDQIKPGRHSVDGAVGGEVLQRIKDRESKKVQNGRRKKDDARESEYKRGLRPVLWLSPDFPLQVEEVLPLLDILANKVKAVRRLRELLTTKLPPGTFPVKVAIPVIPAVRVLVTFTKFEELQPVEEFHTPPTSPDRSSSSQSSSSWLRWLKVSNRHSHLSSSGPSSRVEDLQDVFLIPPNYRWVTAEERKKSMQEKKNSKKSEAQNQ